ncbi:MAG: geranylgeranyl reductase family protein [Chloroflexota bacterium]|nr:geranylgeranyl reductase family protein [Chloroflexota bacterium]
MHDAVIVGAGPGGSATAHFLSRRGLDVLLLDRADFPRDKTCGDGLTPRALRVLDEMGILPQVQRRGCRVDAYEVVAPNRRTTSARITAERGALVVPRRDLDDIVLQRAVATGARFNAGVRVRHVEPTPTGVRVHAEGGQMFEGRVAVIATGAATAVLKRSAILGRQPQAMLAARAYFEDLQVEVASTFSLRFHGVPLPGYGWVFPVNKRAANIGVGFMPRRPTSKRPRTQTTAHAFEDFTRHLGPLLQGARQVGPVKGYPIRVDFLTAPTFGHHTLLVGEAAGLVNPLTGEGIDYALESGKIAADHLASAFGSGFGSGWLTEYDRLLRARFEKVFRFSQLVRDWYCIPPLLNLLVPLANSRPELRQLLANIVLGEREPAGYGPLTMLARLVMYLARTQRR